MVQYTEWRSISDGSIISDIPDSVVNQWPHDEGSGTTLNDNEGTVDGTISGATWTSDNDAVGGYYLYYDGTDDHTSLGDDPFVNLYDGDFTFTFFARPDDTNNSYWVIDHAGVNINFENDDFRLTFPGVDNYASGLEANLTEGEWHFFAVRYDRSQTEARFTIDGNHNDVDVGTPNEETNEEGGFGKRFSGNDRHFDGGMDEITYSDSFLSDDDISTLQNRR